MNASRFASIMEQGDRELGNGDRLVALRGRGLRLATEDIEPFMYKMDDIQIKGTIGQGSYGEVFRAVVDQQMVAVKKLHVRNLKAEQVEAFCNEASLMCQLEHPNVVGFIGAVTEPRNLCIITQYCARGSLADLLLDDRYDLPLDCCPFAISTIINYVVSE
jgi:serine/threonine protein kinase